MLIFTAHLISIVNILTVGYSALQLNWKFSIILYMFLIMFLM